MPADPLKARDLFLHAVGRLPPAAWDDYVAANCADDPDLARQVRNLLRVHLEAGSFLTRPAADLGLTGSLRTEPPAGEGVGTVIGAYKLVEQIGEGGFGVVFLAEQTEPVRRRVAVKVLKPGMDSRTVVARFEAERQALALMDHPNIAKVLDGGATQAGRPYFVMELVKGVPITKYCDDHRLPPPDRLGLFVQVCHAVQHAHQKGVIHRDLKPSNVLVAPYDGRPVPKVIDFGVAKAVGQPLTEKTLVTGFGAVIGTPEYMSPEQAELNNQDIDTRSDIYALGILLYELLTGTTPLTRKRVKEAGLLEVLRLVREEEPPRPSTRLSTTDELPSIAANRGLEPRRLSGVVRGELDWIVMKCLEKDRNRRYESANALAVDVLRHLADEPVRACPPTARYRFGKFVRRHKAAVGIATVVTVAGLGLLAGALWYNARLAAKVLEVEAEQARTKGEAARADANFARTLEAVDRFLSRIGNERLAQVPGMEKVRRDVLEDALRFFQGFLADKGEAAVVRREAGLAYFRVGHIQYLLGRHDEAEAAYRRAVDLFAGLTAASPETVSYRRDLAHSHTNLAILLQTTGRGRAAEPEYRRAIELGEDLVRAHADVPAYRGNLARSYSDLGPLLRTTGRPDEAEVVFRRALDIQEKLAADAPAETGYRDDLARTHLNYGRLLKATGRPGPAEAAYRRSIDLYDKLSAESPAGAGYRLELSGAHLNLGVLLEEADDAAKAETSFRRALDLATKLSADFPAVPEYRSFLAKARLNFAGLLRNTRRATEAEKLYRLALDDLETLTTDYPRVPEHRRDLVGCLNNLGEMMYATRQPAKAEGFFRRALDLRRQMTPDTVSAEERAQFAVGLYNLANLLDELDRLPEAEAAFREARGLFEKLVIEAPAATLFRHVLGGTLNNLAGFPRDRGDLAEARKFLEQAVEHQTVALNSNPRHPGYRQFLANHYRSLAEVLVRQGDHAKATEMSAEAPRLYPKKWEEWARAAEFQARCVPLAEKDPGLTADQRRSAAQAYGAKVAASLREAVANGCPDLDRAVKAAAFDPVRARDDFKQVLSEWAAKKKGGPDPLDAKGKP